MRNLDKLLQYLEANGKTHTWAELCEKFGIYNSRGELATESARKAWAKRKKQKNRIHKGEIKRRWIKTFPDGKTQESIEVSYAQPTKEEYLEKFKRELIEDIKKYRPDYNKLILPKPVNTDYMCEITIPDLHLTKMIDHNESQVHWDINSAKETFIRILRILLSRISGINIEKFVFPIGNDGLNSEGLRGTTTKGTPQNDNVLWHTAFRTYCMLMVEAIDILSATAPVEVVIVPGNHSYELDFYVGCFLEAWYKEHPNVTIDNSIVPRKICTYGNNLIMFTHGDKEKLTDLPLILADEFPEQWGESIFREIHCGHLHIESVKEIRKVKIRRLPSIVPLSSWDILMGYAHLRCAQALIWNKYRGLEEIIQHNII